MTVKTKVAYACLVVNTKRGLMTRQLMRYFWVVKILILAVCGYLLANAANAVIARNLAEGFVVENENLGQAGKSTNTADRNFESANDRNIFGARREQIGDIDAEETPGPTRQSGNWENAVASNLPFRLLGTAVFQDPNASMATIATSKSAHESGKLHTINDCESGSFDTSEASFSFPEPCNSINGQAKVVRIEAEKVYIFNEQEGRYEFLTLEGGAKNMMIPTAAPQASNAANIGQGIRKISETSYEIDQEELDMALANLSKIATQARAVPAFENGKPVGFRLFSIKPNSVFTKIGLQNGDVLNSINGYDLSSPDKALELYNKLKTEKNFTMDFKRNGTSTTLEYNVR